MLILNEIGNQDYELACETAGSEKNTMKIKADISAGELIDKITILEIKLRIIKDPKKWANLEKEWRLLSETLDEVESVAGLKNDSEESDEKTYQYLQLINGLRITNQKLWDLEDEIRVLEAENIPMQLDIALFEMNAGALGIEDMRKARRFIEIARLIPITNDERCRFKSGVNMLLESELTEEKGYNV